MAVTGTLIAVQVVARQIASGHYSTGQEQDDEVKPDVLRGLVGGAITSPDLEELLLWRCVHLLCLVVMGEEGIRST